MRRWIAPLVLGLGLAGCAYMTQSRFDELYDKDEDGWGVDEDCDDEDAAIHPYAADVRGDGCDADCGASPDADGDDWPDAADCAPDDPDVFPCNPAEEAGDGVDSDCDGQDGVRETACNDHPDYDDSLGLDPDFPPTEDAPEGPDQQVFPADCLPEGG
jgi:hypothetical protein